MRKQHIAGIMLSGLFLVGCQNNEELAVSSEETSVFKLEIRQVEDTLATELAPHPFNVEFKELTREYEQAQNERVLQLDVRGIPFEALDIVAFYEQVLKDSEANFAELKVTDEMGLIIYRETGLIGYNPISVDGKTGNWSVASATYGVINPDCTITYVESSVNDIQLAELKSSFEFNIEQITLGTTLDIQIKENELKKFETKEEGVSKISRALVQQLKENPNYLGLHGINISFDLIGKKTMEVSISKEKMILVDWENEEESLKVLENLINTSEAI